jgi:hypothetical protein
MVLGPRDKSCQFTTQSPSGGDFPLFSALMRRTAGGVAALVMALGASAAHAAPPKDAASEGPVLGRPVASTPRPTSAQTPLRACSFREPVCINGANSTPPAILAWALSSLERASRFRGALGLPAPTRPFDLYLTSDVWAGTYADDREAHVPFDSASSFAVLPPPSGREGCRFDAAVARAVASSVALRFDAGVEDASRSMFASYFASLVTPCAPELTEAVDAMQRAPERAFIDDSEGLAASGSFLFPAFLDEQLSGSAPTILFASLLDVATQKTPAPAFTFENEPDIFDALRTNAHDRNSTFDGLLVDFAIARAFVGSRDDGQHMRDVRLFGDAGRVRFDWSIPFESLPRRLAPMRPIEPLGATYLWVDLANAPKGAAITFAADWEMLSLFRWAILKIDKDGAEAGRVDVAGIYGDVHAEREILGLDNLAGLLIVGTNIGSPDRSHPFDPDDEAPYPPHSYLVSLFKQ